MAMTSDSAGENRELATFALRVAVAVGVTIAILALTTLLCFAVDVLLLGFAAVLLAVMLRGLADWLAAHSKITRGWAVALVIVTLLCLAIAAAWWSASSIIQQFDTLVKMLPVAVQRVQHYLQSYGWGERLLQETNSIDWMSRRMNMVGKMTGAISTASGVLLNLIIVGFLGLYLAVQPTIYVEGAMHLIPMGARPRMAAVLGEIRRTLQKWMLGTLISMTVVGVLSGVGLWLLGVPFSLALALLAGLLTFIPYLGALASSIPAMLVALIHGPEYVLYVAALYLGIHIVEGYLLDPMIQQRVVSLPAGLLLLAQITLGILVGGVGVVLAAPIAATSLVVVKMLYVEDILGDRRIS